MSMWRRRLGFLLSAIVVALAGCGGGGGEAPPPPPAPPVIGAQPLDTTVIDGANASFSVTATGAAPLSYQWRRNGAAIAGATGASLSIAASLADSGSVFAAVVSNAGGAVTSNNATLTVTPVAPTITNSPQNATVATGQTATFTVIATGSAPLAYQWRRNGIDVPGAAGASHITPATTAADNGAVYSVVVTNTAGSSPSANAILTVTAAPVLPSISQQPNNVTVQVGQAATFSVVASGTTPLSYQWRRDGVNIPGATASAYTTAPTTLAESGDLFDVVVSNAAGSVSSSTAALTVHPVAPPAPGRYVEVWSTADSTSASAHYDFGVVDPAAPSAILAVDQTPFLNPNQSSLVRVRGGVYDSNTRLLAEVGTRHVVYLKSGALFRVTLDKTGTPAPVRLSTESQARAGSLQVTARSLTGDEALISYLAPVGTLDQPRFVRLSTMSAAAPLAPPTWPGDPTFANLATWSNDSTGGAITAYYWRSITAAGRTRLFRTDTDFGNATEVGVFDSTVDSLWIGGGLTGGRMRDGYFFIADGALRRLDFTSGNLREVMPGITSRIGSVLFDDTNVFLRVQTASGPQLVKAPDTPTSTATPLANGAAVGTVGDTFRQTRDYLLIKTSAGADFLSVRKADGVQAVVPALSGAFFTWVVAGAPWLIDGNTSGNRLFYSNIDATAGNNILGSVLADGTGRKELVGTAMGFGVFPPTALPHRLFAFETTLPYDGFLVRVGQAPVPAGSATLPLAWMNCETGETGAIIGSARVALPLPGGGVAGITSFVKGRADTFTIGLSGRYDAYYFTEQAGSLLRLTNHIP